MKKALLHIHSQYSYDSLLSVRSIVDTARSIGVDYILICDHDSLEGSIAGNEYIEKHGFKIKCPVAGEFLTDIGDIIIVGVPPDFKSDINYRVLCLRTKEYGGITILPHPYKGHKLDQVDFGLIDYIEVFNARCSKEENMLAQQLAERYSKRYFYGADAHTIQEIGKCIVSFYGVTPLESRNNLEPLNLIYTGKYKISYSQIIKAWKTRDSKLFFKSSLNWFREKLKNIYV